MPDDNFEQALIDLGYDSGALDDYVPTANINTVTSLNVSNKNIADLTGIEDFTALTDLNCRSNQLTSLDVSANTALIRLECFNNQLISLNVKNGNNTNFSDFFAEDNPNLTCIEVDDATWSAANWTNIDATASFSENCSTLYVDEVSFEDSLTLYPNPTKDYIYIQETKNNNIEIIIIYSALGQELKRINDSVEQIDMSNLSKGLYIIELITKNKEKIFVRVIKE